METGHLLVIAAELTNLDKVRRFVGEAIIALGLEPGLILDAQLAVDEAVTNIIVHGYGQQSGAIELEVKQHGQFLVMRIRDQAPPFDPTTVPPPDLTTPLAERPPGGMGLHLIRQTMDEMHYRLTADGDNELTLIRREGRK